VIATVAKGSWSAGGRRDRGVAEGVVRSEAVQNAKAVVREVRGFGRSGEGTADGEMLVAT
jgi:hypothetical protein